MIEDLFPNWREVEIYEASPSGPASDRLCRDCPRYLSSYCYPEVAPGSIHQGFRCEDLEALTFPDARFDLVVTQEVFEHVLDYRKGFREVMRTVRPGGAHVFTTPKYRGLRRTEDRAVRREGVVLHLCEAEYHGDPIDSAGSLVTVHYGDDINEIIWNETRCPTSAYIIREERTGTIAEFMDVFVTRKV